MNEVSDGKREKSSDRKDETQERDAQKDGGKGATNLTENASRNPKMVENATSKSSSSSDSKYSEKPKDRYSSDKRYDTRDRPPYKNANGYKSGGRGRRDDDRRPSPSKPYRGRGDGKNPGSYRRDDRRDTDYKRGYGIYQNLLKSFLIACIKLFFFLEITLLHHLGTQILH